MSNNLGRTPVATGQVSNGVVAINNSDNILDAAITEVLAVTVSTTTPSLATAQLQTSQTFNLTGTPGGAATLTLPAIERGAFVISNGTDQNVTVEISGQSATSPIVRVGQTALLVNDGVNVRRASTQHWSVEKAVLDETTTITSGTDKFTFYADDDIAVASVFIGLTTQSSSGVVTVDVNKNGTTIFSTNPSIDANEDTSLTGTAAVLDGAVTFAAGDKISIDIDAAGTGAKGLKVVLIGSRI